MANEACRFWISNRIVGVALGLIALTALGSADAAVRRSNNLDDYKGRNRLLLIFAPTKTDWRYRTQDGMLASSHAGFRERDLLRFDLIQSGSFSFRTLRDASALRAHYGVGATQFRVVLIGKDGHVAYSSGHPISARRLFSLIDAMPMRRDEMHGARATGGGPVADGPNRAMTPEQVVRVQMEALQHNDRPRPDSGIARAFEFASPSNRAVTGPLPHFISLVRSPQYSAMLDFKVASYDRTQIAGNRALVRVHLLTAQGEAAVYVFQLSRQTQGSNSGCWMTDGVMREAQRARLKDL